MSPADVRALRTRMRRRRAGLQPADIARASDAIAAVFHSRVSLRRFSSLALYMSAFGEVDCTAIARRAWKRNVRVFVPVLRKNTLLFAPWNCDSVLTRNRFGILEPVYDRGELKAPSQLDTVVVPVVAFDRALNRLGMGGGFYDRSFAFRKHRRIWRKPRLIGVAHSFQEVSHLPSMPWDIPLDAVITEKKCIGSC